jgi:hypothetical protein
MSLEVKSGIIKTNGYQFPQIQSMVIESEMFTLRYDWNNTYNFIVLTISRNEDILFRSKLVEGSEHIVYNGQKRYERYKVKTLFVIVPISITPFECISEISWQVKPGR